MDIEEQLQILKNQIPFVEIDRPCTVGDGIIKLNSDQELYYEHVFKERNRAYLKTFFIPASGAATRMFGNLNDHYSEDFKRFYTQLKKFPFAHEILNLAKQKGISFKKEDEAKQFVFQWVKNDLSKLPKGFLKFEKRENGSISAFEKHIEDAFSLFENDDIVNIHYTIPENFEQELSNFFSAIELKYQDETTKKLQVELSKQNKNTDTVSVLENNEPLLDEYQNLITRPAGHGALLENLNLVNAEVLFIQNIDNTSNIKNRIEVMQWKRILGGILVEISSEVHKLLKAIQNDPLLTKAYLLEKYQTLFEKIDLKDVFSSLPELDFSKNIFQMLHKPIRVCGMVKNEGQPGGGPFWIKNNQRLSKQIVESGQINLTDYRTREVFQKSTHFNPVNMVLHTRDYRGQKFDLNAYMDPNQYMISWKVYEGKKIKILEYPGLWNGSMANWITIFVEIPNSTFKPVKTVFDLIDKD